MFKIKTEKIYKFVYSVEIGYRNDEKIVLITAYDPVQAVKKFNRMAGNKLYDVKDFVEVVPRVEEAKKCQ